MQAKPIALITAVFISAFAMAAPPPNCRPMKSFEQGHELRQSQMMAAYNAPARIDVRGSWDLYLNTGYIFWQPSEENLELGISNASSANALPVSGRVVDMDFKYKSGLKAGIGVYSDRDNWDSYVSYTWLTGRHTTQSNGPVNGGIVPFWGHPANVSTAVFDAKGKWRLSFQSLDMVLGRSSYIGTKLTFRPYFGGRIAWINQKYIATYFPQLTSVSYQIRQTSTSRGIGPETGLDTNWMIGYDVRFIGNLEVDLLFTRYNLRYKEQDSSTPASSLVVDLKQHHLYYLRPHLDLEMGLGWGSYFLNHNYHIDLLATYGFQIFWNQNMFRKFVDDLSVGTSFTSSGDLFVQGLTAEVRFDF